MQNTAMILREHGLKVTPQRLAIYTMLKNTNSHPNAETIFRTLEPENPTMSLATVYKTLDSFKTANLVTEINTGDGCSHYDATIEPHNHLICKKCNSITDVYYGTTNDLEKKVKENLGCDIDNTQVLFFGICAHCKNS